MPLWACPHRMCAQACAHVREGRAGHGGARTTYYCQEADHAESKDFSAALEFILGSIWLLGLASSGDVSVDEFSLS